jgi:Anaerobic glycerol-3-phosphate dehydrogenase
MSRIVDVLVVGSGMAGLVAALAAADQGRSVRLLTTGMGSLAISGGSVDFLGYADGRFAADPWQGLAMLPEDHPYSLLGAESVRSAFQFFANVMEGQHWPMRPALSQDGTPRNTQLPTIMGTLKPTYLLPASLHTEALASAKKVLALSVQGPARLPSLPGGQPVAALQKLGRQGIYPGAFALALWRHPPRHICA